MSTLRQKVLDKIEDSLTIDAGDVAGRYLDSLNRLQENLFWQENEAKDKK